MKFLTRKAVLVAVMVLAAVAVALIFKQMQPLEEKLKEHRGDNVISLELAVTPTRAHSVLQGWTQEPSKCPLKGASGQTATESGAPASCELKRTAWKVVHWDWPFILAYLTLLLAIGILLREAGIDKNSDWTRPWLIALPYLAALADTLENLGIYVLLASFGADGPGLLFSLTAPLVGLLASIKFLLLFLFVVAVLRSMKLYLQMLSLVRFSLLMLAVGVIAIFVPQWQEVLRVVAEEDGYGLSAWLGAATFIAAITTWYSARVMFMLKLAPINPPEDDDQSESALAAKLRKLSDPKTATLLKTWLPRLLGLLLPLIVAAGFFTALEVKEEGLPVTPLLALTLALILYFAFVVSRRWLAEQLFGRPSGGGGDSPGSRFGFLKMPKIPEFGKYPGYTKLPKFTRGVLSVLAVLNVLALLSVWHNPLWVQGAGGAAVVLAAVGLMIPVGTWLVYWGARSGFPILLLAFGLAALLSLYNDNHWVRLTADASSTDGAQEPAQPTGQGGVGTDLKNYATEWAKQRAGESGGDIPLFLVSAEGGGIRAAYWTAWVLGNLQDRNPQFADHVFAISGVSGGSLGGAVFAAQIAADLQDQKASDLEAIGCLSDSPREGKGNGDRTRYFADHADCVLKQDFLAPTLATLMFADLFQRFLPWPALDDRAMTLEKSWEHAWEFAWPGPRPEGQTDAGMFTQTFQHLWQYDTEQADGTRVPLLFLNSTVVETGNRLIMHPLRFDPKGKTFSDLFKDALDGRGALGDGVPLSTAVHLSARFTYVSPAGSAQNGTTPPDTDRNRRWIRLVDGGYFENSGAVTTSEILRALVGYRQEAEAQNKGSPLARLRPFVIHISNEPARFQDEKKDKEDKAPNQHRDKQAPLGEVLSPLWALLNARPARGYQAREALFKQAAEGSEDKHVHFRLRELDTALPLGWVLSKRARENMQEQLPHEEQAVEGVSRCKDKSGKELEKCRTLESRARQTVQDNEALVDKITEHLDDPS